MAGPRTDLSSRQRLVLGRVLGACKQRPWADSYWQLTGKWESHGTVKQTLSSLERRGAVTVDRVGAGDHGRSWLVQPTGWGRELARINAGRS